MTILESINHNHRAELQRLNERISNQLENSNTLMSRIVMSLLRTKGKQIRPLMVMICAGMFGPVDNKVLAAAVAVELLHNASLIHDDVVDNSPTRRNMPTVNAVWDNHIAVLVGDFFTSSAMQEAISTADLRIVDVLCRLGRSLSLGEIDQIYNAREHSFNENNYYRIIDYKTASLFVASAEMGCLAAGVDDYRLEALSEYALLFGRCFQIRDDIFDYFPDAKIGKPTGNDLREGKITLPLLHALTLTGHPDHPQMAALARKELLEPAEIDMLINFAVENGGIEYARQTMQRMASEATETLCNAFPEPSPWRDDFIALISHVIDREY